jgi:hypothetical protein
MKNSLLRLLFVPSNPIDILLRSPREKECISRAGSRALFQIKEMLNLPIKTWNLLNPTGSREVVEGQAPSVFGLHVFAARQLQPLHFRRCALGSLPKSEDFRKADRE